MLKDFRQIVDVIAVAAVFTAVGCSSDTTTTAKDAGYKEAGCPASSEAGCPATKEAGCPATKEAGCPASDSGKEAGCPAADAAMDAGRG